MTADTQLNDAFITTIFECIRMHSCRYSFINLMINYVGWNYHFSFSLVERFRNSNFISILIYGICLRIRFIYLHERRRLWHFTTEEGQIICRRVYIFMFRSSYPNFTFNIHWLINSILANVNHKQKQCVSSGSLTTNKNSLQWIFNSFIHNRRRSNAPDKVSTSSSIEQAFVSVNRMKPTINTNQIASKTKQLSLTWTWYFN